MTRLYRASTDNIPRIGTNRFPFDIKWYFFEKYMIKLKQRLRIVL